MRYHMRTLWLMLAALLLVACGGTGSDGDEKHATESGGAMALAPDATAPQVATLIPAAGVLNVVVNKTVSVTFIEPMNCATLTTSSFRLKTATGTAVAGTVACSGATATFRPTTLLARGRKYVATVTTAAKDLAGNRLAASKSWSFTTSTSGARDTTVPTVTTRSPAANAVNVAVTSKITATLSEALDCASVSATSVRVKNAANVGVSGTLRCSGRTITFTPALPTGPLDGNTLYTVTLTRGIKDTARNALAASVNWSFRTAWTLAQRPAPEVSVAPRTTGLDVSWAAEGASAVRVYMSSQKDFNPDQYASYPDGVLFEDAVSPLQVNGLTTGKSYYFVVEAQYPEGVKRTSAAARPQPIAFDGPVYALTADNSDNVYVGGAFSYAGRRSGSGLELDAQGLPAKAHDLVDGYVRAAVSDGLGGWYIGGGFTRVGDAQRLGLAHVLADGTVDPDWQADTDGSVATLALMGDVLYVGGSFSQLDGATRSNIGALTAATGEVTAWDPQADSVVWSMAAADGTIYFGGGFTMVRSQERIRLAAVTAAGDLTTWNPGVNDIPYRLAIGYGAVYVAGYFSELGGAARTNLGAVDFAGNVTAFDPAPNGSIYAMAIANGAVYVGGIFNTIAGGYRDNLARLDPTGTLTDWNAATNDYVFDLAVNQEAVYVAGTFTTVNGATRLHAAAVSAADGSLLGWAPAPNKGANSVAVADGRVYLGGGFNALGAQARSNLASLDWDGELRAWSASTNDAVLALDWREGVLYAGGKFTQVNSTARSRVAAIDADSGALDAWNPQPDGQVNAILAADNGAVYIGGGFTQVNGEARPWFSGISAAGSAVGWAPMLNGAVHALLASGDTLYVAGEFTAVEYGGSNTRNRAAAFSLATGALSGWNPDVAGGAVRAMADKYGVIHLGGDFTSVGGESRARLAAVDGTFGTLSGWAPEADGPVYALTRYSSYMVAGGDFNTIAGAAQPRLAMINDSGDLVALDARAGFGVRALLTAGAVLCVGGGGQPWETWFDYLVP